MVHFNDQENATQCAVHDRTPGSEQRKINIVVRPKHTVGKVITDITTQFQYDKFDLVLQPMNNGDLVYLNSCETMCIYDIKGFEPHLKNTLILMPPGEWDGNTQYRFDLTLQTNKCYLGDLTTKSTNHQQNNNNSLGYYNNNNINTNNENVVDDIAIPMVPPLKKTAHLIDSSETNSLNLSPMSEPDNCLSDDDLALGASASPTELDPANDTLNVISGISGLNYGETNNQYSSLDSSAKANVNPFKPLMEKKSRMYPLATVPSSNSVHGLVGLVNQAMTCYLNSLLQALYMTPEFRNALYRWEFDNDNESKSIPYQLQKLFLHLQTSKKNAVETTDLTRSFGWDSNEAWQQHDIQELCRVMFDALEHKFRNTKQGNLISTLYEGKMLDYVKCLECNTEKTRADTFLDIPLPVKPFGSNVAYGSIEEALRAFVQPETLDGNNQYFCEKCNKKCDAHKGLKFATFPYILTLHLKRFDFDYTTMHRIKLNDRVTFPQTLNLNSFVKTSKTSATTCEASTSTSTSVNGYATNGAAANNATTTDDSSTTDSGSAMEEDNCSSGIATTASSSQNENDLNDDDEGIDMSPSNENCNRTVDQKMQSTSKLDPGPYSYELFAIMIHSGSASGGHYYAYIKEFEKNEWFCFNDQSVTPITFDDIQRSFGGGINRAYYSNMYSSSTNAYMLMYRQLDSKRNEHSMSVKNFPAHINKLLPKIHMDDESRIQRISNPRTMAELALPNMIKPRVYFFNPLIKKLKLTRVLVSRSIDINQVLESAYELLNVDQFAPISQCRLVGYDSSSDEIVQSFENVTDPSLAEVRASCEGVLDFLLEYRVENHTFEVYERGGVTWHVFMVNILTMEMDGPYLVYSSAPERNRELRHSIASRLYINEDEFLLAALPNKKAFIAYDPNPTKEAEDHLMNLASTQFRNITYFYLNVPTTDNLTLEIAGIPPYDYQTPSIEVSSDVVDAVGMCPPVAQAQSLNETISGVNTEYTRRESPLSSTYMPALNHESNSEDSSLSDGDRTLVESLQNRGNCGSQVSSSSHSPQLSSPDDEASTDSLNRIQAFFNSSSENSDNDIYYNQAVPQFFHALKIETLDSICVSEYRLHNAEDAPEEVSRTPVCSYKILVVSNMKMGAFKKHIENLIHVSANHFSLRQKHSSDPVSSNTSVIFLNEGETLQVELNRELQVDELKAKVFFMCLSELDNDTGRLPYVCDWVFHTPITVLEAKKDLIAKMQRIDSKYNSLTVDSCRMWVKGGRNLVKILSNNEPLMNDSRSALAMEYVIQQCEKGVEPETPEDSLTLFIRRWHADTLELEKFQEITLTKTSEIRETIGKITDIEEEHIGYSKTNRFFPCTNVSILNINSTMSWFSIPATVDKYPLATTTSGSVFFYKDIRKPCKELSSQERRDLNSKEKARLDRLGCLSTTTYSPRRERALKIYIEPNPGVNPPNQLAPDLSSDD